VSRQTHDEREQLIMSDLLKHFPDFAGPLDWSKMPDGQDPPDFRSGGTGLELVEWLDGEQMKTAKARESQADQLHRILATNWQSEYRPKHFRGAFLTPGEKRVPAIEEAVFRNDFFALAAEVDRTWRTNPERTGDWYNYDPREFPNYPIVAKYSSVRFIGGESNGLPWIHLSGDGGAYSPITAIDALAGALHEKLSSYSKPERQEHLRAQNLSELNLLVHGGFNAFAYNTPAAPLSLEQVAHRAADFYAQHPQRDIFGRVWFFNSLDPADELNKLIGFTSGAGRERRLWQLWPELRRYPPPVHSGTPPE
jgi:hypothetical protein